MKVLFFEWKSFGNEDIIDAFEQTGFTVEKIPFSNKEVHHDEALENELAAKIRRSSPDFVFSFNYFPIISLACKKADMQYVSWIYDSPYVLLYSYTIIYPGNHIFVFDKSVYTEFHSAGITTVHYLPMAANADRLRQMTDHETFSHTEWYNRSDIAFVGSLYTEKHQFFKRLDGINPYTRGYLEGIMSAQKQIQGDNFIQELLPKDIIEDMQRILPMQPDPTSVETPEYLFAQYVINRQITATERTELLSAIGEHHSYDLYTPDKNLQLPGCINHGPVDYYDVAPYVFKHAKINLNISLRSIRTGMPLRIFDIMGAGGFLLTNFQSDFLDYFVPEEDYVYYESRQDLLDKIDYYLSHDEERAAIAASGLSKIEQAHTYFHRIEEMMTYL